MASGKILKIGSVTKLQKTQRKILSLQRSTLKFIRFYGKDLIFLNEVPVLREIFDVEKY